MTCDKCKNKIREAMPDCPECTGAPHAVPRGCGDCGKCDQCGCPEAIAAIEQFDSSHPGLLSFIQGGRKIDYDFTSMITMVQTNTSLRVDAVNRLLKYNAERSENTITAKELGAIFHIADFGDVDISGVKDNSLFVYQKDSDCGQGCEGIDNSWIAWNAIEHRKTIMDSIMGFDIDGKPYSLTPPVNTNQYYNLGWNAQNKISYSQPTEFASFPVDADNFAYIACYDPVTKRPGYVKVEKGTTIMV